MKALEVFKISIKEWIFIIPFDLQSDSIAGRTFAFEATNMVDLVRDRFSNFSVDRLRDRERLLCPVFGGQSVSKPLCALSLTSARSNQFFNRDRLVEDDLFE